MIELRDAAPTHSIASDGNETRLRACVQQLITSATQYADVGDMYAAHQVIATGFLVLDGNGSRKSDLGAALTMAMAYQAEQSNDFSAARAHYGRAHAIAAEALGELHPFALMCACEKGRKEIHFGEAIGKGHLAAALARFAEACPDERYGIEYIRQCQTRYQNILDVADALIARGQADMASRVRG